MIPGTNPYLSIDIPCNSAIINIKHCTTDSIQTRRVIISFKLNIKRLFKYKELFFELFKAFLKLRHVGSVLGMIWTLLNPAFYIATYYFVFTYFIKMGLDKYHLFLIPGFLAWNFTLSALISASESIIQSKHLISKIAFPNEILVLVNITVCFFDFIVSIIIYLAVIFFTGALQFSNLVLYLPAVIALQILFTVGLGLLVATLSVYYRDVPKLVQLAGTIMFFFTPVFYPLTSVPAVYQWLLKLNPMTHIIGFYHKILYYNQGPDKTDVIIMIITFTSLCLLGFITFYNFKHKFAELS